MVAALRNVVSITQALHQHVPGTTDALGAPAQFARDAGEAVTGDRGDHHVEGVGGLAAVRERVGERSDAIDEFEDRAGPAVGKDHRQGAAMVRAHVDEMDVDAVDGGDELRQRVELGFKAAPVVAAAPVAHQCLQLRQREPLRLVIDPFAIGPAGGLHAPAQLVKLGLRQLHLERADCRRGHGGGAATGGIHRARRLRRQQAEQAGAGGGEGGGTEQAAARGIGQGVWIEGRHEGLRG